MTDIAELLTAAAAMAQDRRSDFPPLRSALVRAIAEGLFTGAGRAQAADLAEKLAAAIQEGRPVPTWPGATAGDA